MSDRQPLPYTDIDALIKAVNAGEGFTLHYHGREIHIPAGGASFGSRNFAWVSNGKMLPVQIQPDGSYPSPKVPIWLTKN